MHSLEKEIWMEVIDCERYAKAVNYWDTDFDYSVAGSLMVSSLD